MLVSGPGFLSASLFSHPPLQAGDAWGPSSRPKWKTMTHRLRGELTAYTKWEKWSSKTRGRTNFERLMCHEWMWESRESSLWDDATWEGWNFLNVSIVCKFWRCRRLCNLFNSAVLPSRVLCGMCLHHHHHHHQTFVKSQETWLPTNNIQSP